METLHFRHAVSSDVGKCVEVRGQTRENALSVAELEDLGITAESWGAAVEAGRLSGLLCLVEGQIVGYCFGDTLTGEIVVLAMLPAYEGRGIGKLLLTAIVQELQSAGFKRLYLGCSCEPTCRSYGFYRHLGWKSTGTYDKSGDEILQYTA